MQPSAILARGQLAGMASYRSHAAVAPARGSGVTGPVSTTLARAQGELATQVRVLVARRVRSCARACRRTAAGCGYVPQLLPFFVYASKSSRKTIFFLRLLMLLSRRGGVFSKLKI